MEENCTNNKQGWHLGQRFVHMYENEKIIFHTSYYISQKETWFWKPARICLWLFVCIRPKQKRSKKKQTKNTPKKSFHSTRTILKQKLPELTSQRQFTSVPQLHKSIQQDLQPQDDHHLTPLHELLHCLIMSTVMWNSKNSNCSYRHHRAIEKSKNTNICCLVFA